VPASRTPRRIVCLQPSATVILASVGELDLAAALHADVFGPAHGLRSITEVLPGKDAAGQRVV
jgi:hypothetical protein